MATVHKKSTSSNSQKIKKRVKTEDNLMEMSDNKDENSSDDFKSDFTSDFSASGDDHTPKKKKKNSGDRKKDSLDSSSFEEDSPLKKKVSVEDKLEKHTHSSEFSKSPPKQKSTVFIEGDTPEGEAA